MNVDPTPPLVRFRGVNRHGRPAAGAEHKAPAVLAAQLFSRRWRWAVLEVDGQVVGEVVEHHPDDRRRTWWVYSPTAGELCVRATGPQGLDEAAQTAAETADRIARHHYEANQ